MAADGVNAGRCETGRRSWLRNRVPQLFSVARKAQAAKDGAEGASRQGTGNVYRQRCDPGRQVAARAYRARLYEAINELELGAGQTDEIAAELRGVGDLPKENEQFVDALGDLGRGLYRHVRALCNEMEAVFEDETGKPEHRR